MINFKPTKANLIAHAASLEEHARASLTSWIILGMADKYQRVMGDARAIRTAAGLRTMADRREYLADVDGGF